MKKLIPLVVIAVLLSSACFWTKRFELVDFEKKASEGTIELRASLNDTLFRIQDLGYYCKDSISTLRYFYRFGWWYPGPSEEFPVFKGPKVTFTVTNRSPNYFKMPCENLWIGSGKDTLLDWPDIAVVLSPREILKDDLSLGHPVEPECSDRKARDFWIIAPGDSVILHWPLDVFLYTSGQFEHVHVGEYRVQIIYTSQCWKQSNPEIWIGQARSEWMEFRVIED